MVDVSNGTSSIPRSSNKFLYISLSIIVVVFAIILIIIWQLGFFDFTGTDASSTVVAAAVALIGTILTAVVSVVGILIKHSFDQQAMIRQEIEARRNEELKREAEQRLNLEAAVQALQLFSTSSGKPTPDIQRDGALFTLTSLGQYELALQLVDDLLDKGVLNPGTASSVLSTIILRGNTNEKIEAIDVLYEHSTHMLTKESVEIPSCLMNWNPELPKYVREWGILAIAEILNARTLKTWKELYPYDYNAIISVLCIAWEEEEETRLKENTGAILDAVLPSLSSFGPLWHPRKAIHPAKIRGEVKGIAANHDACINITQRLKEWAAPVTPTEKRNKTSAKSK